jgi:FkbH-like protein
MQPAIETLSIEQKRSLLANLLNRNRPPLQLSVTQERLFQLDQLRPGTPLYNFQTAVEFQGNLHFQALEIAALQVVLRHEALHTSYATEKGRPALSLVRPQRVPIAQHDLSAFPEQEQNLRLESLGKEDVQSRFDLSQPPLLRLTLVRLAPEKHRLYLTMHHIVSDFLSLDLFLFEMGECYTALLEDKPVSLPLMSASYRNFAERQRNMQALGLFDEHLEYWRRTLAGAGPLEWFSDHVRPAQAAEKAETEFFCIPAELMNQVESFARRKRATPFMVLLAAFNVLLHGCSGQNNLIVGSPTSGRICSEYESMIGMFSYPLLLRTNLSGCASFDALLQNVRRVVLESAEHADVPFATVIDAVNRSAPRQAPLLRAMFSYVSRLHDPHFQGIDCRRCATNRGITDLDFFLTLYPQDGEWHGALEYSTDLFERTTIRDLAAAYVHVLQAAAERPEATLAELAAHVPIKPPARIAIAATFTADPIIEVLKFWSRELDLQFTPVVTPYNQIFQQLLEPNSLLLSSGNALNVLLVRPEDWLRYSEPDTGKKKELMERCTDEFITGVRNAARQMSCPWKIYLCPGSSQTVGEETASLVSAAEQSIREGFADVNTIEVLDALRFVERYSVAEVHDARADAAAHIPYTPHFHAALGTEIVRRFRAQTANPCKVLVLDCDNTLWQGLCAEEGPQGVVITGGHRALQEFILRQAEAGTLICLSSKNAPEHVFGVLRNHPGMVLREEHISAYRVNWEPKSSNLCSLAAELNLGLDSFVFIDDDARECAEVSVRCPEVLTLRLPRDPADFHRFLEHIWAFDRENISAEDRRRTMLYRDNARRDLACRQSASLAEFLETLELRVVMQPAGPGQMDRIAQLSRRTNQFNASTLTYSSQDLEQSAATGLKVLAVEVSDRFGDYGLSGAVTYRCHGDLLVVEAWYLSCRVLGRGVEHRILAELGKIAQSAELRRVGIHNRESARNHPFRHFLDHLPGQLETTERGISTFSLTAANAAQAKFIPGESAPIVVSKKTDAAPRLRLAAMAHVPHDLATAPQIAARLDGEGRGRRDSRAVASFTAPGSEMENSIAAEWRAILRLNKVGRDDNFFELGGNSLLLVQLNSNLIAKIGVDISLDRMFQYPTVASLAGYINGASSKSHDMSRAAKTRAYLKQYRSQVTAQKP